MCLNIKIYSTITSIVALAVLCALPLANWADPTTTMNDMDFMKFISNMMTKFPYDTVKEEAQTRGPNVAHEPYWMNVPDVPWYKKCLQCSEIFKKYPTICAVDGTGYLHVNISMCRMMRQNCLRGIVTGRSSGQMYDYREDRFVVKDGWARFSVRQFEDVVIMFSGDQDMGKPRYRIILDGWQKSKNKHSELQRNEQTVTRYWAGRNWEKPLGSRDTFIEFVARWNTTNGLFMLTKSNYLSWNRPNRWNFYLRYFDWKPFEIKFMTITGNEGNKGDWIINDLPENFVVSHMGMCPPSAKGVVGPPLPTSPTEIVPIIESYSTINKAYFKRLKDAGIDIDNITAPLTTEEY